MVVLKKLMVQMNLPPRFIQHHTMKTYGD